MKIFFTERTVVSRPRAMGDGRQCLAQLTARADAELGEYLAQVPFDGAGRQEQLGGDPSGRPRAPGSPRAWRARLSTNDHTGGLTWRARPVNRPGAWQT